jgi:hypothetical protein
MRATAVLLLALSWLGMGQAPSTGKSAKVEEFLKLTQMERVLKESMDQTMQMIQSSVFQETFGAPKGARTDRATDEFQAKVTKLLMESFSYEKIKPEFVALYAETFSDEELDGILAFYRSAAGQAMVTKGLTIMPKASAIAQRRMAEVQPALQKLIKEEMAKRAEKKQ